MDNSEIRSILSTGVVIPEDGVPVNDGGHQFTTRTEKRPETIADESTYLKWKWRMNLANPRRASTTTPFGGIRADCAISLPHPCAVTPLRATRKSC